MAPEPVKRVASMSNLIEIKPGFFVNLDQVVSVRVLPEEEDNVHAVLQLSNGDKLNLTRSEFTVITGKAPLPPARLSQKPTAE